MNRYGALILGALGVVVGGASDGVAQSAASTPITTDALVARLSSHSDSLAARDELSGVVLLAKDGKPVFERAYGFADRGAKRANTVETTFNLSSIGKRFTQVAIAQLVAAGKLDLDSTIASVWPDYPNPDVARQVTIRELLDHRSGIGGNIFANPKQSRSNHDYLPLFVHEPLRFAPGTRQEYSNAGYIVLGEIIARVSHESYEAYVQRRLLTPTGMLASGYFARESLPASAAIGYTSQSKPGALVSAADVQPARGSAAGGGYSSARDLLKFVLATRTTALGIPVETRRSVIAGGSPGSNGVVAEGLPGGYDLIVLENLDPPAADAILTPVMAWLGAPPPAQGRRIAAGAPAQPIPAGATTLPDTPAGRLVADYLRAYNSGDTATMRRFFESEAVTDPARPIAARIDTYTKIYGDNGALELVSVDEASPSSLRITVRSAKAQPMTMSFDAEPGSNRLKSLAIEISR
jgi:D-alanyl-D-alanine carboxypeptidase